MNSYMISAMISSTQACVFCGSTTELTDEHVFPASLPAANPIVVEPGNSIELNFVNEAISFRSATKVALMSVAKKCNVQMLRSHAFRSAKQFVRTGKGPSPVRLFVSSNFATGVQTRADQHSTLIYFNGKDHNVWAVVTFFGGLTYIIQLSNNYDGADYGLTYIYDARQREETGILFGNFEMERIAIDDILNGPTVFSNIEATAEHWLKILMKGLGRT